MNRNCSTVRYAQHAIYTSVVPCAGAYEFQYLQGACNKINPIDGTHCYQSLAFSPTPCFHAVDHVLSVIRPTAK